MEVYCRTAGGKDPLGDVVLSRFVPDSLSWEDAIWKAVPLAEEHNRDCKRHRHPGNKIVTIQANDLLYDLKTNKFFSLTSKIKAANKPQPDLDMPSKREPRLF